MRKHDQRVRKLLGGQEGSMAPLAVAAAIAMLIIILGVSEYMRLVITAAGVKDALESAAIAVVMIIIMKYITESGKDMPQGMSRMIQDLWNPWIMGMFTAECVSCWDWKKMEMAACAVIQQADWNIG